MELQSYLATVVIQVHIDAFSKADAAEMIEDSLGPGEICGLIVVDTEVTDFEVLDE